MLLGSRAPRTLLCVFSAVFDVVFYIFKLLALFWLISLYIRVMGFG